VTDKLVAPDDTKAATPSAPVAEATVPPSTSSKKPAESAKPAESGKKDDTK